MTEGTEDVCTGHVPPPVSPSAVDTGQIPEEKPEEEEEAAGGGREEGAAAGALTCCVCVEVQRVRDCLRSERVCVLPVLACVLSLALCTAGLKWVFADRIFEYDPPTHLDPKRMGQDPAAPTEAPALGLTVTIPPSSPVSLTTAVAMMPGRPEERPTWGASQPPRVTGSARGPTTPPQETTRDVKVFTTTNSATSSTTAKTSSHVTRCSDSQKNYCVNGGECFTLEITPGSTKFLCRCPSEFTGDRCQNYVMASFYKAEELYQKRVLTITGICIALLVVGIMCVFAYCKTRKQRKELHERLRHNLRRRRSHKSSRGRHVPELPLQNLNHAGPPALGHTDTNVSTSDSASSAARGDARNHGCSERTVSDVTTPTPLSPVTPGSPPSEMSAPLSSQALSAPSADEERPLLVSNKPLSRDQQKRKSAHYNPAHAVHSPPSSPSAADRPACDAAENISEVVAKRLTNGLVLHHVGLVHAPLCAMDAATVLASDCSRTNPTPPRDDLPPPPPWFRPPQRTAAAV